MELSVIELLLDAGPVVKLVLLILVYFSVVSWGIIFYKWRSIRLALKQSKDFQEHFWRNRRIDHMAQELKCYPASPLSNVFRNGYQELVRMQRSQADEQGIPANADVNVNRAMERSCTAETEQLEKHLTFLATTASATPFIGLFGTVWGIMDSFHGIGQSGSASLAVVAPGISEALVATAVGLMAAIPAVVAYNHFLNKVNVLVGQMDSFRQDFLNIVDSLKRRS
jgi:biopolymer transport protein TolQ